MTTIREIKPALSTEDALAVLDDLRAKVESGQVIAFAAVGIEPDDTTSSWMSCTRRVTWLRLYGAVWTLLHGLTHE